jgi:hypothetical protein
VNARLIIALLAATAALATAPPGAVAQGTPFDLPPAPAPQQTAPVQTVPATSDDEDEGLSRTQEILIGLGGFALLLGIGWAIVRDARRSAPAGERNPLETGERVKGTRPPKDKRVAQGRAKAKAARQARRRNRP